MRGTECENWLPQQHCLLVGISQVLDSDTDKLRIEKKSLGAQISDFMRQNTFQRPCLNSPPQEPVE